MTLDGRVLREIGRRGEGPGEFLSIVAVTGGSEGSFAVLDGRLRRITVFGDSGTALGTRAVSVPSGLGSPIAGPAMMTGEGTMIAAWSSAAVDVGGPPDRQALVSHSADGASTVFAEVPATAWVESPWGAMPVSPASGPQPFAFDPVSRVAYWSEASMGCAFWRTADSNSSLPDSTCPPISRVELRPYVPTPGELTDARITGVMAEMLGGKHEHQTFEGYHDAFQRLFVGPSGCLWLRIVKSDAPYDPFFDFQLPSLRPEHYEWWVWDAEANSLTARVLLPNRFHPWFGVGDHLYGTVDDPLMTQAVGRVQVGGMCTPGGFRQ